VVSCRFYPLRVFRGDLAAPPIVVVAIEFLSHHRAAEFARPPCWRHGTVTAFGHDVAGALTCLEADPAVPRLPHLHRLSDCQPASFRLRKKSPHARTHCSSPGAAAWRRSPVTGGRRSRICLNAAPGARWGVRPGHDLRRRLAARRDSRYAPREPGSRSRST
jgi:hypothetical protein